MFLQVTGIKSGCWVPRLFGEPSTGLSCYKKEGVAAHGFRIGPAVLYKAVQGRAVDPADLGCTQR